MSDITMCMNKVCPLKSNCYRYVAIPDKYWQSYADFKYNNGCLYFLPISIRNKEKELLKKLISKPVDIRFKKPLKKGKKK